MVNLFVIDGSATGPGPLISASTEICDMQITVAVFQPCKDTHSCTVVHFSDTYGCSYFFCRIVQLYC